MLKFLTLLLVATVTYAQIPQPCFSPPLLTFHANQYDHDLTTFRDFDSEYDAQGERFAFYEREETTSTPGRQYYHIVVLHREHVVYEYNRNTKACRRSEAGPFHPFAVPENARFEREYYIGGPMSEVGAVEWSDRSDVRREEWIGVFSRIHCYPIRTWVYDRTRNESITSHIYDLVSGISNPTLFVPEPQCSNATVGEPSRLVKSLMSMYTRKYQ